MRFKQLGWWATFLVFLLSCWAFSLLIHERATLLVLYTYIWMTAPIFLFNITQLTEIFKRPNSLTGFLNGEAVDETTFTTVQAEQIKGRQGKLNFSFQSVFLLPELNNPLSYIWKAGYVPQCNMIGLGTCRLPLRTVGTPAMGCPQRELGARGTCFSWTWEPGFTGSLNLSLPIENNHEQLKHCSMI